MIRAVEIRAGCIACSLCQDVCPAVFEVRAGDVSRVRPTAARLFRAALADSALQIAVRDAVLACPVQVITTDESTDLS